MIHPCRFVYPYFDNPGMLKLQVENWNRFDGELRDLIRIIIVDDHSAASPAPILKKCRMAVHCYRLRERFPWNMHECRNIGAHEASTPSENHWLFMSDIDNMLTPEMAYTMLSKEPDPSHYYTMDRVFAPYMLEWKTHSNTFLVKYDVLWRVNGYDLDLNPIGGGGYGGDGQFLRQLQAIAPRIHRSDVALIGYGRSWRDGQPVIPDSDTRSLDRAEWSEKYHLAVERKKQSGDLRSVRPIRTSYERIL
jgi:hypothetical protein